jgi:hypothetical protein
MPGPSGLALGPGPFRPRIRVLGMAPTAAQTVINASDDAVALLSLSHQLCSSDKVSPLLPTHPNMF